MKIHRHTRRLAWWAFAFVFSASLEAATVASWGTAPPSVVSPGTNYTVAAVGNFDNTSGTIEIYRNSALSVSASGYGGAGIGRSYNDSAQTIIYRAVARSYNGGYSSIEKSTIVGTNAAPVPRISVDGYGYGSLVWRPIGGSVNVTVRFGATASDNRLSFIRANIWHPGSGYFHNPTYTQSSSSGEVALTVTLDRSGDWYFWTDAQTEVGTYASTGDWGNGFRVSVLENHPPSIQWASAPATVYKGQPVTVRAQANDIDYNLKYIFIDLNGVPHRHDGFNLGLTGHGGSAYLDSYTFTAGEVGSTYNFSARSSDGMYDSSTISHTVTVANRAPAVAAITASKYAIYAGQSITLSGRLTDPDGNLSFHSLWWDQGSGKSWTNPQFTWGDYPANATGWSNISNSNGSVANRGDNYVTATWTPSSVGTYKFHTNGHDGTLWGPGSTITVNVPNRASATIAADASTITYGQSTTIRANYTADAARGDPLSQTAINIVDGGTESTVNGYQSGNQVWTFTPSHAGTYTFKAYAQTSLTPAWTVYASTPVTVNKATPTVTWPTPAVITYGTALSGTQLNATCSLAGTFSYTPASGTVLDGGARTLSVTFTPTDTTNYATATKTVPLTVNKATPTVTWPTLSPITYGTPLSGTQLNATCPVPGSFTYSPASGTYLSAGSHTLSVTFTPTNTTNYNSVTRSASLTVAKATPTITWGTPAAITYGTALSGIQLNAATSVAGAYSYSPASGTVLDAGSRTLSVTFTPTNTTNYTTASKTVPLTVNEAAQTIDFPQPPPQSYGTPFSLGATASSGLPVSYEVLSGPATIAGNQVTLTGVGDVTIRATQDGKNEAGISNYSAAEPVERTIEVNDTGKPKFTATTDVIKPVKLRFGSAGFELRWTARDDVGVVRYDLKLSLNGALLQAYTVTKNPAETESSVTQLFEGLLPDTQYTITAVAFDQAGNASDTLTATATTAPLNAPPAPENYDFELRKDGFTAWWAEAESNMSLDYYKVEVARVINGVYQTIYSGIVQASPGDEVGASFNTASSSLVLNEATKYRFRAQAVDTANNHSAWGAEEITTLDQTPPGTPAGLGHTNLGQTSLTLTWNAVTDNSGVVRYLIKQYIPSTASWVTTHLDLTGTSQAISNLHPGTGYQFSVQAYDQAKNGTNGTLAPNYSSVSTTYQVTTLPPTPIINSPASWTIPQNAYVQPYQITALHGPTSFGLSGTLPTGLSFNTTAGRISGTPTISGTKNVTLQASNAGGTGQAGLAINVIQNGLMVTAAVSSGVSSNWLNGVLYVRPSRTLTLSSSGSATTPFVIDWVEHEIVQPGGAVVSLDLPNPNNHFAPISYSTLSMEGVYRYRTRLVDGSGNFIEATAPFTVDATPPSAVTGFAPTPGGAQTHSIALSWNAATDANGVSRYSISGSVLGSPIVTTGRSTTIGGLQPGMTYSFAIVAIDAAGNESTPVSVNAGTLVQVTSPNTWSLSQGSVEGFSILTTGTASSYSVVAGSLPPGLSLNTQTGVLSGAATSAGAYTFTLGASNAAGTQTQSFTITVNPATAPNDTRIGFEAAEGFVAGSLTNQVNWAVPHGTAAVSATSVHAGATAIELPGGATRPEITRAYAANPAETVTFVDIHARPVAKAAIEDSTMLELEAARVGFRLNGSNAVVEAYDGAAAAWKASAASKPADAGGTTANWVRLTMRLDYGAKSWDLYVDDQLQLFDLGFADPTQAALEVLKLRGATSGVAFVDDVLVSFNNPLFADADKDGMPDSWETANGLSTNASNRGADDDDDGLTNFEEYLLGTKPAFADSDGDGITDGQEVSLGLDPTVPDGFWDEHTIGQTLPAGADFLIIDGDGGIHGVSTSTLIINAAP